MTELDGAELLLRKIQDRLAICTHKMVMRSVICLHPERAVVHADFPEDATIQKCSNILVNRSERNRRDFLLNFFEDCLRTGVPVQGHHRLKNYLTLVGGRQSVTMASLAEFLNSRHS